MLYMNYSLPVGKSPRPTRPSASPAVTKKQQPDSKKEAPAASRSDRALTRPSPPRDTVQMRNKQNSDKAPPRPNTVATGNHIISPEIFSGLD